MQSEAVKRRRTPSDLLDVTEVAAEFGVHEETVRRWIRGGKIHAFQLFGKGGMYRVRRDEVDRIWNEIKTEVP